MTDPEAETGGAEGPPDEPQIFERVVILTFTGDQMSCQVEGGTIFEAPTLLRRAAGRIEEQMGADR